jgi:D-alanyl-D-alanine carboxypeptidase
MAGCRNVRRPVRVNHACRVFLAITITCCIGLAAPAAAADAVPASASIAERGSTPSHGSSLYSFIRRQIGNHPFEAVVMRGGVIVATAASAGQSVDRLYRTASISKAVTSAAVFALIRDGKLALDTPVVPLLGIPAHRDLRRLTVSQLLSHTSRLPVDLRRWFGSGRYRSCPQAAAVVLAAGPAGSTRYSNSNYCLLSLVIEAVSGTTYESAVQSLVFEPLGISEFAIDTAYRRLSGAAEWLLSPVSAAKLICSIDPNRVESTELCNAGFLPHTLRRLLVQPTGPHYARGVWRWANGAWGHSGTLSGARNIAVRLSNGDVVVLFVQTNSARLTPSSRKLPSIAARISNAVR